MKILLVDDSKTVLFVVSKMLKELGYTDIQKAEDPIDAEEKIKISPPDLIISDWNMPKGTGLDLLKFVRSNESTSKTPFILLTSDHDKAKIVQARPYAPQAYLLKPMVKSQIAERLDNISITHGIQAPNSITDIDESNTSSTSNDNNLYALEFQTDKKITVRKNLLLVLEGKVEGDKFIEWLTENFDDAQPENVKNLIEMINDTIDTTLNLIE